MNYELFMKHIEFKILVFVLAGFLYACDSAYDISMKFDHEVPSYKLFTDSLTVSPGQTVAIKVEVSDNIGLAELVFSYSEWSIMESLSDALRELNYPKSFTFETSIIIPEDAREEWIEDLERNDGSIVKITQNYHKLNLEVTDVNLNVRNVPINIRVRK